MGAAGATAAAAAAEVNAAGGGRGSGGGGGGGSSPTGSGDSEASADAVFRDAMRRKGLSVVDVEPDGNCLFRSVSHQIFGDVERHYPVRKACVEHMSRHKARFGVFVAEDFRDYLYRIRQPGVWGDDLEIRWVTGRGAAARLASDRPCCWWWSSLSSCGGIAMTVPTATPWFRLIAWHGHGASLSLPRRVLPVLCCVVLCCAVLCCERTISLSPSPSRSYVWLRPRFTLAPCLTAG